jgi:hypothetical protein
MDLLDTITAILTVVAVIASLLFPIKPRDEEPRKHQSGSKPEEEQDLSS